MMKGRPHGSPFHAGCWINLLATEIYGICSVAFLRK